MVHILKVFILPSTLIVLTATVGSGLLCTGLSRKIGARMCIAALIIYTFFAEGPISFLLLGHLEYMIQPATASERAGIQTIVVLAAHAEPDDSIPVSAQMNSASAFRVLQAIHLIREVPVATLIVSGEGPTPDIMAKALVAAGIPRDQVRVDEDSSSTVESARQLLAMLGHSPFLLVTSAGHMPRAVRVFQKFGMNPRAAPTHYLTNRNWLATQYIPSPLHLRYSDLAISEYVALLWYGWNGWL